MQLTLLRAKLHHLRVTACEPEYQGSLTVDEDVLDLAGILPYEKVLVANLANGERFETYAMAGERGSRVACLNGAAALKGSIGDRLIVMAWARCTPEEAAANQPTILCFDERNTPVPLRKNPFQPPVFPQ
jgi:aspartate 1-decarboxylase